MIIPDINLLLHANNPIAKEHSAARNWMEAILTGSQMVGFSWPVICGFLRISTNPRALLDPLDMQFAMELVDDWLSRKNVLILSHTNNHWLIFSKLLSEAKIRGAMTSDAEIATYAIEHGGTLHTTDRGFARFPDLKFINPIA